MELPRSINLGPDNTLSKGDLSRALVCAMAVYLDNVGAENLFQKHQIGYPSLTFDKVHMSLDLPKGQKFLVAYAEDDIFIAFQGTETLKDVACDLRIDLQKKFGGSFHRGFFDRANVFMGLNHDPLPHLLQTSKRIIFCGHSLGGAVSHMVLLRFLLENDQQPSSELYPDSMFSIAFGAPHICDNMAARKINNNENFKWRFINFVNHSDPVPHMLHRLKSTVAAGLRGSLSDSDKALQDIGGFVGKIIESFDEAGPVEGLRAATKGAFHLAAKTTVTNIAQLALPLWNNLLDFVDSENSLHFEGPRSEPDFYPIGQYISLDSESKNVRHYHGSDSRMTEFFDRIKVRFTTEDLEYHQLQSYKMVLIALSFIDIPNPTIGKHMNFTHLVKTPVPKVTCAKWVNLDSDQRYILVEGENLLFLREAVSFNGLDPWRIKEQSDSLLVIFKPHMLSVSGQDVSSSDKGAVSMVIIKTAFGQIHQPILEDYSDEKITDGVSGMISKIVQALITMATPPMSIAPPDGFMKRLDDIMQCVPTSGLKGRRLSTELDILTKWTSSHGGNLQDHIKEINHKVKTLVTYLRSSLQMQHLRLSGSQQRACAKGLVAVATVASIATMPIAMGASATLMGVSAAGILMQSTSTKIIHGYDLVLKSGLHETSEWSKSVNKKTDLTKLQTTSDLETELVKQVEGSSPVFKDMIQRAHSSSEADVLVLPDFKSKDLQKATPGSRLKLLKRIKVVFDTISLYNELVAGIHFLGVIGAEDAGKSTFIKKVLEKFGKTGAQLPETGFHTHTNTVKSYTLNKSLWLVDFPGCNGAESYADSWRQFTALSSSCILFLEFEFDVKSEQIQMYKDIKETQPGAKSEMAIVFNKVDERFSASKKDKYTAKYFKDQRKLSEAKLGCTGTQDRVYFSCVDPDLDPPEKFNELKAMGVLGFEELVNELVRPKSVCALRN